MGGEYTLIAEFPLHVRWNPQVFRAVQVPQVPVKVLFCMGAEHQGNDAVRKTRGVSQQGSYRVGSHDEYQGTLG